MKKMALFLAVVAALFVGCSDPLDVNAKVKVIKCNDKTLLKIIEEQLREKELAGDYPSVLYTFDSFVTEGVDKESRWVSCLAKVTRNFTANKDGKVISEFEYYKGRSTDDGLGVVARLGRL